mgnify:CR=1 FL=1
MGGWNSNDTDYGPVTDESTRRTIAANVTARRSSATHIFNDMMFIGTFAMEFKETGSTFNPRV